MPAAVRRAARAAALLIAVASLPVPWYRAGGAEVPVYRVPPMFAVTYFAGLAVAALSLAVRERLAPLSAALLLATSPAYVYFALRATSVQPVEPAAGALLCAASAALLAADWLEDTLKARAPAVE